MKLALTIASIAIALLVVIATGSALYWPSYYGANAQAVASEGLVWDMVNLALATPLFVVATIAAHRDSLRGSIAAAGLTLYFVYVYFMYATMMALTPLFFAYVAITGIGVVTFGARIYTIDLKDLARRMSHRFPRRFFTGFAFAISAALLVLWGLRVDDILRNGFPPELEGMTTLETQAFDLGLIVPLAVMSGVLLLRRHPWGYLLAALTLTFGAMMFVTIPLWIAVPLVREHRIALLEAIPFLVLCLAGAALVAVFFRSVEPAT